MGQKVLWVLEILVLDQILKGVEVELMWLCVNSAQKHNQREKEKIVHFTLNSNKCFYYIKVKVKKILTHKWNFKIGFNPFMPLSLW